MELDLLPNLKIRIAGFLFSPQSGGESDPYSIETIDECLFTMDI